MQTFARPMRLAGLMAGVMLLLSVQVFAAQVNLIVAGNDTKIFWDENAKQVFFPPGKDTVSIIDISNRMAPRIVANLPLMNSVIGPPVNLQITPDGTIALIASSMDSVKDGEAWKAQPDNKLYVVDLKSNPPALLDTLTVGKQPSGLAINRAGTLALVANRADNSVTVLSIEGKTVKVVDTVPMGEQVASVAISPDGRRALVTKFPGHKIALLQIEGQKVTYTKYDMPVGQWPYNVAITPNGKLGLVADNGNAGSSDGNVDTVSVIDMEADPIRVIDRVVVGDAPEGLAISPTGKVAVAILLKGTNVPKTSWFYHKNGGVVVLKIDGKKVTRVNEVEVGPLPEGVAFSPDGKFLYVGNYMGDNVSVLRVDGTRVTNTGKTFGMPGHPASMRGTP